MRKLKFLKLFNHWNWKSSSPDESLVIIQGCARNKFVAWFYNVRYQLPNLGQYLTKTCACEKQKKPSRNTNWHAHELCAKNSTETHFLQLGKLWQDLHAISMTPTFIGGPKNITPKLLIFKVGTVWKVQKATTRLLNYSKINMNY